MTLAPNGRVRVTSYFIAGGDQQGARALTYGTLRIPKPHSSPLRIGKFGFQCLVCFPRLGEQNFYPACGEILIRFKLSTLFVTIFVAAIVIKFGPQMLSGPNESSGLETKGSGTYFWLDNTRATLADRDVDYATFAPNSKPGNLVLIDHICELLDPEILGGFAVRKIMIQLPDCANEGDEFKIAVQQTSKTGLRPGRLSTEAPDGMACIFYFDDGGHSWLSDIQKPAFGSVRIRKMTNSLVTIDLNLSDEVMMRPGKGAIPTTLNLVRRTSIVR
jgi:hypothetical protein